MKQQPVSKAMPSSEPLRSSRSRSSDSDHRFAHATSLNRTPCSGCENSSGDLHQQPDPNFSQLSKPGTRAVYPKPCNASKGRISAPISGWDCPRLTLYPGFGKRSETAQTCRGRGPSLVTPAVPVAIASLLDLISASGLSSKS